MELLYLLVAGVVIWYACKLIAKSGNASAKHNGSVNQTPITPATSHNENCASQHPIDVEDRDEWEGSFWEVAQPLPAKAKLRLSYTDGADRKTERSVEVRQFGAFGEHVLIIGHCAKRNATRTFRSDRISFCIDEDTGEIVSDIRTYLQSKYNDSPDRTKDQLLVDEYDTLRVLLYIGKADGQLRSAEKAVIRDTCVALTRDSRLTDKSIDELLLSMSVPTPQAFKLAVGRLSKRDAGTQAVVIAAAEKMVATQKAVHASEQDAIDYMRKRFSGNAGIAQISHP
ncbi:predicted transcriptional regulator [Serpentinimonas maccroryi]|uniref:Predicted transcriptional regulator n=1 Tax=Serpentinimonas maccroryi TaxID=1458426 RepID=A0A060NXN2_9BURK|nr:WYL domain-containing protein [Serpentinimonas maccroryi]BAO84288.1 predicted transcriptional regulator [Serpentinimonas maccroryi]